MPTLDLVNSILSRDEDEIDLQDEMLRFQRDKTDLTNRMEALADKIENGSSKELASIIALIQNQRYMNLVIFFVVVITALSLIAFIISRSITRPLQKTLMLQEAVEQSIDGIAVTDWNDGLCYVNRAWAEMHGVRGEDILEKEISFFHTPDQIRNEVTPFHDLLIRKNSHAGEIGHRTNDQVVFPTWTTASVLKDHHKDDRHIVYITRDISEQKRNEKELIEAKKTAEETSIIKSRFLANMSHEIRTPMNGVIGLSNILLDMELGTQQREYAGLIKASGESLLTIINDILDYSKIEAGKLDLERIDFNLCTTVEEAADIVGHKAFEKGLELTCFTSTDTPYLLRGDPTRLRQVIINLVTNAVKFTHEGEVGIDVTLKKEYEDRVELLVKVEDTGIGISKEGIKRLFTSFSQVDSSTTRKYGGTGLGLTISKQIVEMMNGDIGVESTEGEGSIFWFNCVFDKQHREELISEEDAGTLSGKRILIVTENKKIRYIIEQWLRYWDCDFEHAVDAASAGEKLKKGISTNTPYDLVLNDIKNPDSMIGTIKEDPSLRRTILVQLTTAGNHFVKTDEYDSHLLKPVKKSNLFQCLVSNLCDRSSSSAKHLISAEVKTDGNGIPKNDFHILLVEDNKINRKVAQKLLEKLGYATSYAVNGKEAVEMIKTGDKVYDLILMDVQMPEMNGYDATRRIRVYEKETDKNHIPIVAMTANAMVGDRDKCLESGMDDYLSKPVRKKDINKLLKKWLETAECLPV